MNWRDTIAQALGFSMKHTNIQNAFSYKPLGAMLFKNASVYLAV